MESQDNFINESLILVFLDLFVCVVGVGGVGLSLVQLLWPWDYNPPGSSVHGVFQTRILEWVAMSSSRGSF